MTKSKKDDDLTDNIGDASGVRKKQDKLKLREDREKDDLSYIMGTPQGRRFLWRLLSMCGVFNLSFAPRGGNNVTFFNEGGRQKGLILLDWMAEADQKKLGEFLAEHMTDRKTNYGDF